MDRVPWELAEPIVGFELRRGSSRVKLVLAHEEYDGVRELVNSFEESHEQRTPVTLHVSCTPAQGNAKLRLVTSPPAGEERREVLANWQRMVIKIDAQNRPVDKEEYLKSQPMAFPELLPTLASEDKWRYARRHLQKLVRRVEEEGTSKVLAERSGLAVTNQEGRSGQGIGRNAELTDAVEDRLAYGSELDAGTHGAPRQCFVCEPHCYRHGDWI